MDTIFMKPTFAEQLAALLPQDIKTEDCYCVQPFSDIY